jgi:hypothetical protein
VKRRNGPKLALSEAVSSLSKIQPLRGMAAVWAVALGLGACGGDGRNPPTQPEMPPLDAGEPDPNAPRNDPGTDTGEPVGPLAAAPPSPGRGGGGGTGGLDGIAGLGAAGSRSPIGSAL